MGLLIIFWTLFFAIHSILTMQQAKKKIQNLLRWSANQYRLGYNFIAIATFFPILAYQFQLPTNKVLSNSEIFIIIGGMMMVIGTLLILYTFRGYSVGEFLGFKQTKTHDDGTPIEEPLVTTGLNAFVRHPLYLGTLITVGGFFLYKGTDVSLVFLTAIVVYLVIGIGSEEKKLVKIYGESYLDYQRKVKRLIPFIW